MSLFKNKLVQLLASYVIFLTGSITGHAHLSVCLSTRLLTQLWC